jgi:hypothetical protein
MQSFFVGMLAINYNHLLFISNLIELSTDGVRLARFLISIIEIPLDASLSNDSPFSAATHSVMASTVASIEKLPQDSVCYEFFCVGSNYGWGSSYFWLGRISLTSPFSFQYYRCFSISLIWKAFFLQSRFATLSMITMYAFDSNEGGSISIVLLIIQARFRCAKLPISNSNNGPSFSIATFDEVKVFDLSSRIMLALRTAMKVC